MLVASCPYLTLCVAPLSLSSSKAQHPHGDFLLRHEVLAKRLFAYMHYDAPPNLLITTWCLAEESPFQYGAFAEIIPIVGTVPMLNYYYAVSVMKTLLNDYFQTLWTNYSRPYLGTVGQRSYVSSMGSARSYARKRKGWKFSTRMIWILLTLELPAIFLTWWLHRLATTMLLAKAGG